METAFLILVSVCLSVITSVSVVSVLEKKKKNGYRKIAAKNEMNGNIIEMEKLANRIIERERQFNGL